MSMYHLNGEKMSEGFDPSEFTEKELLKHLYREVKRLDQELKDKGEVDNSIFERLHLIEMRISEIEVKIGEREKEYDKKLNRVGLIATIVGLIIAGLALFL